MKQIFIAIALILALAGCASLANFREDLRQQIQSGAITEEEANYRLEKEVESREQTRRIIGAVGAAMAGAGGAMNQQNAASMQRLQNATPIRCQTFLLGGIAQTRCQ